MTKKEEMEEIIKYINSGTKCPENCPVHNFYTHNTCITCKALKDSPYFKEELIHKTDEEIAADILATLEEIEEETNENTRNYR